MNLTPPEHLIAVYVSVAVFITLSGGFVSLFVTYSKARKWVSSMIEDGRQPIVDELKSVSATMKELASEIKTILMQNVDHAGSLARLNERVHESEAIVRAHSERIARLEVKREILNGGK